MNRCFELAILDRGTEGSNPLVGAVIVHDGKIIGEGWHRKYGGPHAEVNAVASVSEENRKLLSESTIYVSLEPCFHVGKTPPCVNLLLEKGFKKVVISCKDVNEKVAGQSIRKLRDAGVEVITGILENEGMHLIRRFNTFHTKERPYIILKWAQSQDGFIGKENEQIWLTGKTAKTLVHKWRAEEASILVGTNTAITDNPRLTNRLYYGKSPLRIILDRSGRIPNDIHLLDGTVPTLYVTESKREIEGVDSLHVNFEQGLFIGLMTYLRQQKIKSLIIEGGGETLRSFIEAGLWDEARVFTSPIQLGNGIFAPRLGEVDILSKQQIGKDTLHTYLNPEQIIL